ncbi:uncharacterized protein LOC122521255 [Polistes fuscatus]|uniref:uncharacterized protein LOC122521255 n=1 Tax=Polistes fuscatus TaxID=30207 RepID=UPI001CA8BC13|nr:uncharacterized protein LOC122521255 [Polistes fuscatus]
MGNGKYDVSYSIVITAKNEITEETFMFFKIIILGKSYSDDLFFEDAVFRSPSVVSTETIEILYMSSKNELFCFIIRDLKLSTIGMYVSSVFKYLEQCGSAEI